MDQAILLAWEALTEALCPGCGRPKEMHPTETADDYEAGFDVCPAMERIAYEQAEAALDDQKWREAQTKESPLHHLPLDRARTWSAWHRGHPPTDWTAKPTWGPY